ncbi:DUF4199 domain-containing protein [Hymenobacter sp. BT18]|uniref:DUF4199 domain-containing protein n=1 Tax=Hymenobacter sp. BT18 TaxID=2835648 RepID=UPI00143E2C85|nr:DUF4199 domain-containing protein [Hymenobacter sp. BT18]QIX60605.1 DUF4199 domain-containing protein [Hymenobacter sp. BT18]
MESTAVSSRPVLRVAAVCGVITGVLCICWVLFLYKTGNNPYGPKRTLSDFFPPLAAIVSQLLLRRQYANGPGLLKAVGVGLLTTLLAAAVAATGLYLFAQSAGPGLIEQHLAEAHKMLAAAKPLYAKESNGLQQYEATLRNLARTPQAFAQDEFLKKILLGFVVGIPGGIFLRK